MRCERIDVSECRISDAGGRMPVMQQLSNIASTTAHDLKSVERDRPQLIRSFLHPLVDGRISFDRAGEPKESIHLDVRLSKFSRAILTMPQRLVRDTPYGIATTQFRYLSRSGCSNSSISGRERSSAVRTWIGVSIRFRGVFPSSASTTLFTAVKPI